MKKIILPFMLFVVSFAAVYLILCYLPGMRIKLSAEPMEYFISSIKSNIAFKTLVSGVIGLLVFILSFFLNKRAKRA